MRCESVAGLVILSGTCSGAFLINDTEQPPACGISCFATLIPTSACLTIANTTCICNDPTLFDAVDECLLLQCSPPEALRTAELRQSSCNQSPRVQYFTLAPFIPIEILVYLLVPLRFFSRVRITKAFRADDYLVLLALILFIPFAVLNHLIDTDGIGVDTWNITAADLDHVLIMLYAAQAIYIVLLPICRMAMLLFYLSVFNKEKDFRIVSYLIMTFITAATVIFLLLDLLATVPVMASSSPSSIDPTRGAYNANIAAYTYAGFGILQDILVLILPMRQVSKLNRTWKETIGLVVMFSLGILVTIVTCIRFRSLVSYCKTINPMWDYASLQLWSSIEAGCSIIVLCLPATKVMLNHLIRYILEKASHRKFGSQIMEVLPPSRSQSGTIGHKEEPLSHTGKDVKPSSSSDRSEWTTI